MALWVWKFGGSSVATPERIRHVARRIAAARQEGRNLVVVVSAMGDTTDDLIALARELHPEPPTREMDALLATGEQASAALVAMALDALGHPAQSFTGWQAGILTEGPHGTARIRAVAVERLREVLDQGRIPVVAGFQGITEGGDVTTLGRGGSDTTAVALAAALGAERCEIFSDVEGVFTADPRVVPDARLLPVISYDEMMELARLGAQVLHHRAVICAQQHGLVIHARSTFSDHPGTRVVPLGTIEPERPVSGVTSDRHVARLALVSVPNVPGIAHRVFSALSEAQINVDMISQSVARNGHQDIAFTIASGQLPAAHRVLEPLVRELPAERLVVDDSVGKVSAVGAGMATRPGVASTMFGALAAAGINIEMISTSEISISCLVARDRVDDAVRAVHAAFHLGEE
ncbi:MAG: aspartate kinase [Bacillota bacterium]|nr:MAG: aspartate kinase [Bacillota bacterium]